METLTSKAFCEVSQSFAEVHNYSKSCSIYGSKKVPNYSPIGDGWINDFWRRPFHSRCGRIIFWQKCFMATVSGLTDELVLTIIVIVVVIGGAWCCCDLDRHSKNGRFFFFRRWHFWKRPMGVIFVDISKNHWLCLDWRTFFLNEANLIFTWWEDLDLLYLTKKRMMAKWL